MNSAHADHDTGRRSGRPDRAIDALRITRLLQLSSPTLPVGAYSWSGGLEWPCDSGLIGDERAARGWIVAVLERSFGTLELPVMLRAHRAAAAVDSARLLQWNEEFIASRETAETRAETLQMGYSALVLSTSLGWLDAALADALQAAPEVAYPIVWGALAQAFDLDERTAAAGYAWSWLENQVMASVRLVPLGQTAAQRLLADLSQAAARAAQAAIDLDDASLGSWLPGLTIASCRHETQYSRLFRS